MEVTDACVVRLWAGELVRFECLFAAGNRAVGRRRVCWLLGISPSRLSAWKRRGLTTRQQQKVFGLRRLLPRHFERREFDRAEVRRWFDFLRQPTTVLRARPIDLVGTDREDEAVGFVRKFVAVR